MILTEIAARIPTKPIVKIGYKYDNLMKSYKAVVKMNNQSGWGLTQGDLDEGRETLREKILSRCPYFFRLDAILGDLPNDWPPAFFDSGADSQATTVAIENLLGALIPSREIDEQDEMEEFPGMK
ncbi:hypothetical protein HOY82DRAFT_534689 [Tuber indicum]|nr:hypothetical protein HOY82DRAFT_534689 [Tuber indicum]